MKKEFLMFIFFLISYNSYSQIHIDLGGGATIKKEIYNKGEVAHRLFPNIEIVAGYETKFLIIQAEMKPSITRNTSASTYFGAQWVSRSIILFWREDCIEILSVKMIPL